MHEETIQKFRDLASQYGFNVRKDGEAYALCARNTDDEWTKWIKFYPIKDVVSYCGNTDYLNIWLCDTRKDFTPEKILQFVNDLNVLFDLSGNNKFLVEDLIDPEDWQMIANVRNAYKDPRYAGKRQHSFDETLKDAQSRSEIQQSGPAPQNQFPNM